MLDLGTLIYLTFGALSELTYHTQLYCDMFRFTHCTAKPNYYEQ